DTKLAELRHPVTELARLLRTCRCHILRVEVQEHLAPLVILERNLAVYRLQLERGRSISRHQLHWLLTHITLTICTSFLTYTIFTIRTSLLSHTTFTIDSRHFHDANFTAIATCTLIT